MTRVGENMAATDLVPRAIIAFAALWMTAAAQAQPPKPVPGKLETYRDWTIGCDNGGRCQAASLVPADEGGWNNSASIMITREGGGVAEPEISFRLPSSHKAMTDIMIDGFPAASAKPQGDVLTLRGRQASNLIRALAHGTALELRAADKTIGHASLNRSYAALRYMDARQGRAGTATALVATGRLGASAVRQPPAMPVIRHAVAPQGKGVSLWQTERANAYAFARCTEEYNPTIEAEVHRLDIGRELVLVPCGAGAYNFSSVPLIASGQPGRRSFAFARFDYAPGWSESANRPTLVNASWDARTASLGSYAKGRGLGDCGSSEAYAWDGYMFRLTQATAMGECRGARKWITLYRARTMPKK